MSEQVEILARCFQAVSVATRIKILCLLKQHALCVGAITARLGITQGAVSQHLRILREAGLIEAERRGYHVHYRQREGALLTVRDALEQVLRCESHAPASQAAETQEWRSPADVPEDTLSTDGPRPCRPGKTRKYHGARKRTCISKINRK